MSLGDELVSVLGDGREQGRDCVEILGNGDVEPVKLVVLREISDWATKKDRAEKFSRREPGLGSRRVATYS